MNICTINGVNSVYLIVAFYICVLMVFVYIFIVRNKRYIDLLKEQAQRRSGFVKVKYLIVPTLKFSYDSNEVSVLLTHRSKSTPPYIKVYVKLNIIRDCDIVVARENIVYKTGKLFGYKEIKIGDDSFDAAFFIRTKDDSVAISLLNEEIKTALNDIKDMSPELRVSKGTLSLIVPRAAKNTHQLDQIVEIILAASDQLKNSGYIA